MAPHVTIFLLSSILLLGAQCEKEPEIEITKKDTERALVELAEVTESLVKTLFLVQASQAGSPAPNYQLSCEGGDCEELTQHLALLNSWNITACADLAKSCFRAQLAVFEGLKLTWDIGWDLEHIGQDLINCPSVNPIRAVRCYNSNIKLLKKTILEDIPKVKAFIEKAKSIESDVKTDYNSCVHLSNNTHSFQNNNTFK